jgi:hypothetical protein
MNKRTLFEHVDGNRFKLAESKSDPWDNAEKIAKALEKTWKREITSVDFSYQNSGLLTFTVKLKPTSQPSVNHPGSIDDLDAQHGNTGAGDSFYNMLTKGGPKKEPSEFLLWFYEPTGVWSWSEKYTWPENQHIIGTPKTDRPFGDYTGKKHN